MMKVSMKKVKLNENVLRNRKKNKSSGTRKKRR